ncbi:hypothetical protein [uncultured Helicobacter sp.]|uniref:hypothetical protein n=1 Tax=uncultured Helicobacter sp. TaxID=175537 RepID=UPI00263258FD|nr:hypothetical protein [uncultured Helicobacter sp.]
MALAFCVGVWANEMEFIISYKAKMQNDLLVGEDYRVSEVIENKGAKGIKNGEYKVFKLCKIIPQDYEGQEDEVSFVKKVLKTQREVVLDCLYSSGVKIYDEVTSRDLQAKSKTIFSIPPKRVIAKYENGVLNLGILEKVEEKK